MNTAFYTGVSGMIAFQEHLNTTSHNIANVSTKGYKAARSSFSDLIYTQMDVRTAGEKLTGHGVKNGGPDLVMTPGTLAATGRNLDFAIVGEGFFALDDGAGNLKYTRNGNFTISTEGRNGFLVSATDGSYVLDGRGRQIKLTKKDDSNVFDTSDVMERLGVYAFPNEHGLERADGSCFTVTEKSGAARSITDSGDYELRGLTLENSSVDLGNEMINIIQSQRAFQLNSKVVQTADQLEELVNNLRT